MDRLILRAIGTLLLRKLDDEGVDRGSAMRGDFGEKEEQAMIKAACREFSALIGIDARTIETVWKNRNVIHDDEDRDGRKPRGTAPRIYDGRAIPPDVRACIRETVDRWISEGSTATIRKLRALIFEKFNIRVREQALR